jgi:hypothetical protein
LLPDDEGGFDNIVMGAEHKYTQSDFGKAVLGRNKKKP